MKHQSWGSRSTLLTSSIFGLGLFIFLVAYLQGAVVSAAVPGSAVEDFLEPEELVISTLAMNTTASWSMCLVATETEKVYFPLIFNDYFTVEDFLEPEELVISTLAMNTTASTITLSVAPGTMVDIVLSVIDEDGTVVVDKQNLSPTGEVETIADLSINEKKKHEVLISTEQGEETDYALMLLDDESYNFVLRGTFFESGLRSDSLPEDTDHFWFFNALSGDSLSFTIAPDLDGDAYVELYNPAAERILTVDHTGAGTPESLVNYPLPDSGLYGIRVGEFDFLPMNYQIAISK